MCVCFRQEKFTKKNYGTKFHLKTIRRKKLLDQKNFGQIILFGQNKLHQNKRNFDLKKFFKRTEFLTK